MFTVYWNLRTNDLNYLRSSKLFIFLQRLQQKTNIYAMHNKKIRLD